MQDHIKVHGLAFNATLAESPWSAAKPNHKVNQPVSITLDIFHDISGAGLSDDLSKSVDYSAVSDVVRNACERSTDAKAPLTAFGLAESIISSCLSFIEISIDSLAIEVELPKALLRSRSASVKISRLRSGVKSDTDTFFINDLRLYTIIGIRPREREDKQPVIVNLVIARQDAIAANFKFDFSGLELFLSDVSYFKSFQRRRIFTNCSAH